MTTKRNPVRAFLIVALVLVAATAAPRPVQAADPAGNNGWQRTLKPDGFVMQLGRAKETTTATIGLKWDWHRSWRLGRRTWVTGYNELSIGHWRADSGGGEAIVTQVGLTPTLRFWPSGEERGWFYEGAIGINVLTPVYRTRQKRFSTAFNFGDHIAVGYRLPSNWEWALRLQHFSNAGIEHPNPGEDFIQLRVTMPLS